MKTIKIKHPLNNKLAIPPLAIALGFFDGVHKGHKDVILKAKSEAEKRGLKSGVMTFYPHPKEVLRKDVKINYLTPLRKKEELIAQLGIDYLIIVGFDTSFSELIPQQFVDQYLIGLNVKHVVAGFDYSYGRLGKGTMETLPFHSRNELTYTTVGKVHIHGEKISSTNIRGALNEGNIKKANNYLGWTYETVGIVVEGEKRGRTIGFPTANVEPLEKTLIPASGVYIVRLLVNNVWYNSVCNIGYKPTFHNDINREPTIEVHILEFEKQIYGEMVKIQWLRKIRDEKKFDGVDNLIKQLKYDVHVVVDFFEDK